MTDKINEMYHAAGTVDGHPFAIKDADGDYDESSVAKQNPHLHPSHVKAIVNHTQTDEFTNGDTHASVQNGKTVNVTHNGGSHFNENNTKMRNVQTLTEYDDTYHTMKDPQLTRKQGISHAEADIKDDVMTRALAKSTAKELHGMLKSVQATKKYRDAYVGHLTKHGLLKVHKNNKQNESTVNLIDAISQGDTIASAQLFNDMLMSKVSDLIDSRRQEVAQNMFNKD